MSDDMLVIDDLSVATSDGTPIVTDVSFTVGRGEAHGLVGESGSGKTLTGLACMNLLPPGLKVTTGTVTIDGAPIIGPDVLHRGARKAAMVFQNPMTSLNPAIRVGAQIAEAARRSTSMSRREAARRAIELLELVDIPDPARRARQWPHELSGGQRQRVVIAIALACEAPVLIADEPTTALDVTTQAGVVKLLDRLREELGLAVVFVSHDLALVSEVCSRLMVMYAGQLVETGSTKELLTSPHHPYLAGLLRCLPENALSNELVPLPGRVPRPLDYPAGCRFEPRCAFATAPCAAPQPVSVLADDRTLRCNLAVNL